MPRSPGAPTAPLARIKRVLPSALVLVSLLVSLELLAMVADLLLGPWSRVHWEERINVRGGLLFACGHTDLAGILQYKSFCGGCTGEGLMAMPLFLYLGPSVLVWKIVPAVFHVAITVLGTALAWRTAGPRCAAVFVCLLMAAPGYYRDLTLTGWGNHAESEVFPLLALLLLVLPTHKPAIRTLCYAASGLVSGLGLWFCHTSVHALPATLLAVWLLGTEASRSRLLTWRKPIAFLIGLPIGLIPWLIYHHSRPRARTDTWSWWGNLDFAPLDRWADFLLGPSMRAGLWNVPDYGELTIWSSVWWAVFWILGLLGIGQGIRKVLRTRDRALAGVAYASLGLVFLLLVYLLRYDLWSEQPDIFDDSMFNLRYRIPLIPTLSFGIALAFGWLPRQRLGQLPLWLALVGLVGFGLDKRISTWTELRKTVLDLRAWGHEGGADGTVPIGDPPKHVRRTQGREVDIQAAIRYLQHHTDDLPDCRLHHTFELGRRLGLGISSQQIDSIDLLLRKSMYLSATPDEERFLAWGIAKGLLVGDQRRNDWMMRDLDYLDGAAAALGATVGKLAGREIYDAYPSKGDIEHQRATDPRIWAGICAGRGWRRAEIRSHRGMRWPPDRINRDVLTELAGLCIDEDAYWEGLGWGWGRYVGCRPSAHERLHYEAGGQLSRVWTGYQDSCRIYRVGPPLADEPPDLE